MKTAAWADGKRGVFLVIFKQPGANVIDTVDRIKAQLPRLIATIPPAIKIKIMSDRTLTIRAAVEDVQITLLITIVLVIMVIFIFLRSFWATVIPAVTVPLALLGACALMWAFGYTLDNLSLMALTIAVGFVVDDAIVMLENITRYDGVADADPDDGLALPTRPQRNKARAVLSVERTRVRTNVARLRTRPRSRAALEQDDACDLLHDHCAVGLSVRDHSQGLLPAAG
jgi:HAE1 family hydrophobic/amphiphilic exporter-1